ncbi:unnamed protein product [Ambrosiozyma monospora]|uniref:Unnamed protein product n=1 Tax=Ambrosiozyma monospora TaxID=43982 RepID=A0ACB5SZY6_AMBMO|nr:unnamed protein product [Ambrosiozyma monospora]
MSSNSIRHLISISELTTPEFKSLVSQAAHHKKQIKNGIHQYQFAQSPQPLAGQTVTLLFTKRSTRTRISSEGAAAYFAGTPMFLGKEDIQLGVNESLLDSAKVISSMTSCIFARVDSHQVIQDLCRYSSVPVINSLCDTYHPLQAICDLLTIKEAFAKEGGDEALKGLKLAWIGDANNVINDLAIAALKFGINVSIATPEGINMSPKILAAAEKVSAETGAQLSLTHDPKEAASNANVLVTDTFVSMGEEAQTKAKLQRFKGFCVDESLGAVAAPNWKFMHCLPRHEFEVSDGVFYDDKRSLVFGEAENRLYAAIAVIEAFVVNKGKFI